jgi:hypothetical protein
MAMTKMVDMMFKPCEPRNKGKQATAVMPAMVQTQVERWGVSVTSSA